MNKRCCQYPLCFTYDDTSQITKNENAGNPFTSVTDTDYKYIFDKSKYDTAEIYVTSKILKTTFHFGVKLKDKVKDVKKHVMKLEKIPTVLMHIFFKGILLGNTNTLEECGVKNKSSLILGIKLHTAWCKKCKSNVLTKPVVLTNITVKSVMGDIYHLVLPLTNPVETLKDMIEKKFKIYPNNLLIMHEGRKLEDDVTLREYGITSKSNLILVEFQYDNCTFCAGCAKAAGKPTITLKFFDYTVVWALYPEHTVRKLKETTYQYLYHIHPDLQKIIFLDKELQDEYTLKKCGVVDGSELIVMLKFDCRKCDKCNSIILKRKSQSRI